MVAAQIRRSLFWYDHWTKMGALYYLEEQPGEDEIKVREFMSNNQWDKEKLLSCISVEMTEYIMSNISPVTTDGKADKAIWMGNISGEFSVKIAWEIVRKNKDKENQMDKIWNKRLPFKINFFL